MKALPTLALALTIAPTLAEAHGQADHSVPGTLFHHLTDVAHAGLFWGGLILTAALMAALAARFHRSHCKGRRR
jgi:hypothetical protein